MAHISDLVPDSKNANRGTQRGAGLLEKSLRTYGAGRSILLDKNNNILAGNKTIEAAASIGMEDVLIVESDGKKIVCVKRTDLDINDPQARELAIADNRTGQVSLEWDGEILQELLEEGVDLSEFWHENELAVLLGDVQTPDDPREHWTGMTSSMPDEPMACRQLTIYFKKPEHVEAFSALLEQTITDNTKSLWYPPKKE